MAKKKRGGGNFPLMEGCPLILLPTRSEERELLRVGSIPVAILPSCQYMKMLHYNCTGMNIVG